MVWKQRSQSGWDKAEEIEEMQRSTVRQKDASETEEEGLQNSDQASRAISSRNIGYN